MQVDRSNFKQLLPQIIDRIQHSDFVAFDCQFTGLVTKLGRIQGMFSNHIEFYQRIKQTAYNFRIIQLGLTAFIYKQGMYYPYVYNFYITPSTFTAGYNNVMVCEVQSMEFLAKNKLDFNRVFCQGINSKRLYSNDFVQKHQYNQFPTVTIDNMFLSGQDQQIANTIQTNVIPQIMTNFKIQRTVDFKNKTLFNYFRYKYPGILFDKGKKNMKQFQYNVRMIPKAQKQQTMIKVSQKNQMIEQKEQSKNTQNKNQSAEKEKQQQIQQKQEVVNVVEDEPCISKIFAALITGRKPLIGHFPNLDIGLIYQTFITDLPQTYEEFCYNLNQMFPFIFDTKVLSRRIQSKLRGLKVDLASLFKACSNPKLLKPYANFNINGLQQYVSKQHQAGYDSFITGCSFIGMTNYLCGEVGRINVKNIQQENMIFYSRYSGQVSLNGNRYCSNAINYNHTILIQPYTMVQQPKWQLIAKQLSKFGSLTVHEDHDQIYYVYEEPKNILEIINNLPYLELKTYDLRKIMRARNMYKSY